MNIDIQPKTASALVPTDILFQTVYWGQVKSRLGWQPVAFDYESSTGVAGDILLLVKNLGDDIAGAYVPQGPEHGPEPEHYGPFLETLSEAVTRHLDRSVAFIRYDLPWESQYAQIEGDGGNWIGRPEARLRELRMNFGTRLWNLRKAKMDMTVADALVIDLTLSEEELLAGMKPKTRYNIGLARRKGVRVFTASPKLLPAFYQLYLQTAARDGFAPAEFDYFPPLFGAPARRRGHSDVRLLFAASGSDLLAGIILIMSGRGATYLIGASSNEKRNLMPCYALQWAGMQLAKSKGCLTYDLGAVSAVDDPTHHFYGLYRFKTGFGGEIVHRGGSWDFPIDPDGYRTFRNLESLEQINHAV